MKKLTDHVRVMGNGYFNFYLIGNQEAALVECGTRAGASIFARQWRELDDKPEVRWIIALHSHFDHICGVPILKQLFPEAKLLASAAGRKILAKERIVADLYKNDSVVSDYYVEKAFIEERPDFPEPPVIEVDQAVGEGDIIRPDGELKLKILAAPGHSVCSIAAYLETDQCLLVSDAAGYGFQDGSIAPVFFYSYSGYMAAIQKFMNYPCRVLGPAHGEVKTGDEVGPFLKKAAESARQAFEYIKSQLQQGADENALTRELFQRYVREGLSHYSSEMMMESMSLLIRSVKAEMQG